MHRYWLLKKQAEEFTADGLDAFPEREAYWNGVREEESNKWLKQMRCGDVAFFFRDGDEVNQTGLVTAILEVTGDPLPDGTAYEPDFGKQHSSTLIASQAPLDPLASIGCPRWWMVPVRLVQHFARGVSADDVADAVDAAPLQGAGGPSVLPLTEELWSEVVQQSSSALRVEGPCALCEACTRPDHGFAGYPPRVV